MTDLTGPKSAHLEKRNCNDGNDASDATTRNEVEESEDKRPPTSSS